MTPDQLPRLERALVEDRLPQLVTELRAEGLTITAAYKLLYGPFQDSLRAKARTADVAKLLAAAEAVQHALGATFEPELFARIDQHLRARTLRELVTELHDKDSWSKRRLYDTLHAFTFALDAAGREDDTIKVEDELDALSGWGTKKTRLWPDEPLED